MSEPTKEDFERVEQYVSNMEKKADMREASGSPLYGTVVHVEAVKDAAALRRVLAAAKGE